MDYKFTKSQEKFKYLMYMNEIKPFSKKLKRSGESGRNNKNIQPQYGNGIWHRKICHAHN